MLFVHAKGFVESVDDPAYAGRILCRMAELDDGIYPEWISPIFQGNLFLLPRVGDTVMLLIPDDTDDFVEFAEEVYYLGVIKRLKDTAADSFTGFYPKEQGIETPEGSYLVFDDSTDAKSVRLGTEIGPSLHLKDTRIDVGGENLTEAAVLGAQLNTWLTNLCAALSAHATFTTDPTLASAINTPVTGLIATLTSIRSSTVFLK